MEAHKELHALLERAADLMVRAGYSSFGAKVKVAGKEKTHCFMESGAYIAAVKRRAPPA